MWSRALVLLSALAVPALAAPQRAAEPDLRRGVAVLASTVGHEHSLAELESFVRACRLDHVVVDFAWVTHHFARSDLAAIEKLARRLRAQGVHVAAMYRPRALRPDGIDVRFARDASGQIAEHHNQLCFAHPDSRQWGAEWGSRILRGCPSIDEILLYNLGRVCRCSACAKGGAARHTTEFLRECRQRWQPLRCGIRIGHVGVRDEYRDAVDRLWPFLALRRESEDAPVQAASLVEGWRRTHASTESEGRVALVKCCWASETRNRSEDVAAVLAAMQDAQTPFCLWYYGWLFHSQDGRYDAKSLVDALGGEWGRVASFLAQERERGPALDPRSWVWFDSRESEQGPRLILERGRRTPEILRAEADSVLISYLPDRAWGRLPRLSLSMGDTNRVLLRFPKPETRRPSRAILELRMHVSQIPPAAPFELAVHAVTEDWSEAAARWNAAPAFAAEPIAVAKVEPGQDELRIELKGSPGSWSQGLLLKVREAARGGLPAVPARQSGAQQGDLIERVLERYDWAEDVDDALRRARAEHRLVLAFTYAGGGSSRSKHEELLATTLLGHPDLVHTVQERFVPVRIERKAWFYLYPSDKLREPDPLTPLGTSLLAARAPALVVAEPNGKHIGTLASIGTYDYGLVLSFLREALTTAAAKTLPERKLPQAVKYLRAGDLAAARRRFAKDTSPTGEERYWHAALLEHEGEFARAREILQGLAAESERPFALLASLRLADPLRVGQCVPLVAPQRAEKRTELVQQALEFLLQRQREDGSWPVAADGASYCVPGVTVLAARALHLHEPRLSAGRRAAVHRALVRAESWMDRHLARADPTKLNSFAAAYHLDYRLDRYVRSKQDDSCVAAVRRAIRLLAGGVCANGAWAYDKNFGENWRGGLGGWPVTDKGRTHSCNTGPALAALARARAAGFDVDDSLLQAGVRALRAMRKSTGIYTYTWPEPRNFEREDASIARAPVCELALLRLGESSEKELRQTLDLFLEHRQGLIDVAKLSPGWLPPHAFSSYFLFFAYHHAAEALSELGARDDLEKLRDDLLGIVEQDGTWVDYEDIGKCYGTAMALLVLGS
jgi:hypothetical protein